MHKFGQWKVGITVIAPVAFFIGGIHYPFMEVLGILPMGNLEGKILWNIVGISLLAFLSTFRKTVVDG